jgi:hypothetical protein
MSYKPHSNRFTRLLGNLNEGGVQSSAALRLLSK